MNRVSLLLTLFLTLSLVGCGAIKFSLLQSLYERGMELERTGSGTAALAFLLQSESGGYVPAMRELSRVSFSSGVSDASLPRSLYWETQAAEHGDYLSQKKLARLYEEGFLVPQNKVKAYAWWKVAVSDAPSDPTGLLQMHMSTLERRMSKTQLARAFQLTQDIRSTIGVMTGQNVH